MASTEIHVSMNSRIHGLHSLRGDKDVADTPGYIYLDSNAFWVMKPTDKDFDEDFRDTVERLRGRFKFPFSKAHFLDIAVSDQPGNEANVERDLAFLAQVSQRYAVVFDHGIAKPPEEFDPTPGPVSGGGLPWVVRGQFDDVAAEYRNMPKAFPEEPSFRFEGTSHEVNLNKLHKPHPLKRLLQAAGGVFSPEILQVYAQELWDGRDNPGTYRTFRECVSKACESLGAKGTLLGPEGVEGLAPLKALMTARTPEEVTPLLLEATDALCSINGQRLNGLLWPDRLVRAYHLLDFHAEMWEPVNKKNRPSNMGVDSEHLVHAAGMKHLVTCDQGFAKKAKVVFSAFGIRTRVSDVSGFKAIFS